MRGTDSQLAHMFSDVSERRVPADHPLRPIRVMVDAAFKQLSRRFEALYSPYRGRPSVPPEKLLWPCCGRCSTACAVRH